MGEKYEVEKTVSILSRRVEKRLPSYGNKYLDLCYQRISLSPPVFYHLTFSFKYDILTVTEANPSVFKFMLNKVLVFLSGKKSIIAGLITTTSAYLVSQGCITADTGAFIAAISLIIFGTASVATTAMYKNQ